MEEVKKGPYILPPHRKKDDTVPMVVGPEMRHPSFCNRAFRDPYAARKWNSNTRYRGRKILPTENEAGVTGGGG